MAAKAETVTLPNERTVHLTRVYDAPVSLV
jgi:hypothetical protein